MSTVGEYKENMFIIKYVDKEGSDQTAQMCSLIGAFFTQKRRFTSLVELQWLCIRLVKTPTRWFSEEYSSTTGVSNLFSQNQIHDSKRQAKSNKILSKLNPCPAVPRFINFLKTL